MTYNVSDPITAQKQIFDLNSELMGIAKEYRQARETWAKFHYKMKKLLAIQIVKYQAEKKNLGVDMAILKALSDESFKEREEFKNAYYGDVFWRSSYKGLEKQFEAIQGQIMSIQSLLKYYKNGEMNY